MTGARGSGRQRVAVVTGGGGGIGAAIAEQLGRAGTFVVTVDPLVSVDGAEQLPPPEETTAGRIVAAGGAAQASPVSVTDRDAVHQLFDDLVRERGGVDAVVNVAGITRPTGFATGSEDDWRSLLSVHLDGYRNILDAALPIMAAAGHGRILGVTSGSGWRPANAGAYSCAKRAVAALTWQLGRCTPPGVVVNAMSPIAATRMVTAALARAPRPAAGGAGGGRSSSTGGLSLASMPTPEQLGPLAAHLVDADVSWCSGQVIFAGGSELALVDEPRLLEAVRTDDVPSLAHLLQAVTTHALVPAEAGQVSAGGANARFAALFDGVPTESLPPAAVTTCAIITDRPEVARDVTAALEARGVSCTPVEVDGAPGFAAASAALASADARAGALDAVVVALAGRAPAAGASEWERVLAEHAGIVADIHADASWARAVADLAASAGRDVRLVSLVDGTTSGGRSRAQASAQLARAARGATDERVSACSVSVETGWSARSTTLAGIAAHLVCTSDAAALSGAELVAGPGWFGLRSHPRPGGSIAFGGPEIPPWLDDTLRSMVGGRRGEQPG